jgi:molybdate transport system regulatory protein
MQLEECATIGLVSEHGASLDVRLRIDLGPRSSIGPGKIALLERIEASGSLAQAARELGMSYRRAWLLLDDLNHALAQPVTTASVGGAGGGGARLTPFGRELIAAYREVEHVSHDAASARLAWLAAAGAARGGRGSTSTAFGGIRAVERRPLPRTLTRPRETPPNPAQAARPPAAARSTAASHPAPGARAHSPRRRARAARRSSPAPRPGGRRGG